MTKLQFADDVLLIGASLEAVRQMLQDLATTAEKYGLSLHYGKTKVLSNVTNRKKHRSNFTHHCTTKQRRSSTIRRSNQVPWANDRLLRPPHHRNQTQNEKSLGSIPRQQTHPLQQNLPTQTTTTCFQHSCHTNSTLRSKLMDTKRQHRSHPAENRTTDVAIDFARETANHHHHQHPLQQQQRHRQRKQQHGQHTFFRAFGAVA